MQTRPSPHQAAALAHEAERLARTGQADAAAVRYQRLLELVPDHARALAFLAMQAYDRGALDEAQQLIDRAAAGQPRIAIVQANRATILRARGDNEGALAALLDALERDPDFVPARLDAGLLLAAMGRLREAADQLNLAMARLPPADAQPPALRERTLRAEEVLARERAAFTAKIQQRLAPIRSGIAAPAQERFVECLEIFLGHARPQVPKPAAMYFPGLPPVAFFRSVQFDWMDRLEAATATIRAELEGVLRGGDEGFIPYVQKPGTRPGGVWEPLNYRSVWGAYFLFNQGQRVEKHCAACPQTTALLESLPLVRIPGRGPTAFFSRLKPGTHIPPHHGATNTRAIVHLPLVVPPDCALRVGNHTRTWEMGKALVFDDTIEHEAWNRSDRERVVLIFDVWNPYLSQEERDLVVELTAALSEHYPERLHNTDF